MPFEQPEISPEKIQEEQELSAEELKELKALNEDPDVRDYILLNSIIEAFGSGKTLEETEKEREELLLKKPGLREKIEREKLLRERRVAFFEKQSKKE